MRSTAVCIIVGLLLSVSTDSLQEPRAGREGRRRSSIEMFIKKMTEEGKRPNQLIHEKSPYLLQHAFNPVDWYSWGDEAFAKAREEHKPIFLSVGYSTCHWCHVMERESFENDSIAAIMNRYFVCIKVDREERPDVDKIYMAALQGMGQNGGWPMSMFLTPDLKPFYGGTYFPPSDRYGRIGFPELLKRIHEIWETQREKVLDSAEGITTFLREISSAKITSDKLDESALDTCYRQIKESYDPECGGFGGGPKFPRPVVFNFLLRYQFMTGDEKALEMVERTLTKMSEGGIHDHIGGGFHRYSVDGEWRVPHFEKMLYDQAQIVNSFLELYQIKRDEYCARVARDVLEYVIRDMTDPAGGFYSAEDADSPRPESPDEEGEGAFYLWSKEEIMDLLGDEDGKILCSFYGVTEGGNALTDPLHEFTGKNILYIADSISAVARRTGRSEQEVERILSEGRTTLFNARSKRPRPHLDDKILTSWNGLMISAFARAYQVLGDEKFLRTAQRAATFVLSSLYDLEQAHLYRRFREGEAKFSAHLDDYAFLVQGLLDLFEASFDSRWFYESIRLTEKQIEEFWDSENGGFFDSSGKDSSVLVRMKEQHDGAEPTGNSIAIMNLLRLADMMDKPAWRDMAEEALSSFGEMLKRQPVVMPQIAVALAYSLGKNRQIILVGSRDDSGMRRLIVEISSRFLPNKIVLLVDDSDGQSSLKKFLPFLATLSMIDGKATAYVCEDYVCKLPTNEPDVLGSLLDMERGSELDE